MPTPLVLEYDYCKRIDVPNALAKKLKENENAEWGEPWSWYVKWATLHYCDGDKEEHEIDALEDDGPDCKRDNGQNWDDEEESDDEEEEEESSESMKARGAMDGDGFVICEGCGEIEKKCYWCNSRGCDEDCVSNGEESEEEKAGGL